MSSLRLTRHGGLAKAGNRTIIACRACKGRGFREYDGDITCFRCGRLLATLRSPMRESSPEASAAEERRRESARLAAKSRWSKAPPRCQEGHPIEGDNVKWSGTRARCKRCYYDKHRTCPEGHEYTPETTRVRADGKRLCLTCLALRRGA